MKLFAAAILFVSTYAFAQEIQLNNGKKTLLIQVGGASASLDQDARIARLERAVRDLQDQVYQLSTRPTAQANWYVCEVEAFGRSYKSDKQNLEYDAREQAKDRCTQSNNKIHCNDINCKKIN